MRRNTLNYRIRLRNPEDRSQTISVAPGDTYDDSGWIAAQADATGGQTEVEDLSSLTVPNLRKLADEREVEVPADAKKDDLVELLS